MKTLALGTMSGTSLDGIDIALCSFTESDTGWTYEITEAQTIAYPDYWTTKLSTAHRLSAIEFLLLHNEYGRYTGELISTFLSGKDTPRLIASHGHTIFHQPENKLTFQLGNGASIAAQTGITTICDFRNFDVALGGQGAPLVPYGDQLLFADFDYCLNIGGFANISFMQRDVLNAFDISPANIVLNNLARQAGFAFDRDGKLGASGKVSESLLHQLNNLRYYAKAGPKSLGREWIDREVTPLLAASGLTINDQAATFYEHIVEQIIKVTGNKGRLLATGGGAKNKFLIGKLKQKSSCEIILPDERLIDFKEALIFAFLGVLALNNQINIPSSVTGSDRDHTGGIIYNTAHEPDKSHQK